MPKTMAPMLVFSPADDSGWIADQSRGLTAVQTIGGHWIAKTLENNLFGGCLGEVHGMFAITFLADEHFAGAGFALQARREVNDVADRRIVL